MSEIEAEYIARSLLRTIPSVSPSQTNDDVLKLLSENSSLIAVPVVENGKPIGLINRSIFMDGMAKPFRRELFARKSCIAFMDKDPLIVNQNMSIQALSFKVVHSGGKTLNDGFIITDENGGYLGLGTGEELVKVVAYLQAEKNRLVMESINYASIIQKSFLRSSREDMNAVLQDYFMHWEPRDKVGGDYYFCKKFDDGFFFALIDCTGHGVPGAFMTLIMASFLDHILLENNRHDPAGALAVMNRKIKCALGQTAKSNIIPINTTKFATGNEEQSDDGMDTAFCWVNTRENKLIYAGAKIPLFYIENESGEVNMLNPDRKGVGYVDTPMDFAWVNQEIALSNGMCIYLTTDGIIDQIGGPKNIAFGKKRFSALLSRHYRKPMPEQESIIMHAYYEYQGKQRRRDDLSLMGFRI
ncbi:SpoIIE family protein phosphatase [Sulfuriferula sp. AH1]|uniref:SpoIIE family protein phosphatase n=1 Tax=Sulfuriferula sp. AH1 TaxID=1985873 RepID=UPI001CB983CD|nr:SpoIIE family protein phosphatase [Sulfuriferula sp. AH1]